MQPPDQAWVPSLFFGNGWPGTSMIASGPEAFHRIDWRDSEDRPLDVTASKHTETGMLGLPSTRRVRTGIDAEAPCLRRS
jgi:hypothetical protein